MDVVTLIVNSLIGVAIGLALIIFSDLIADFVGRIVGNSIIRDTNNPWTYKILGSIAIAYSILRLFL